MKYLYAIGAATVASPALAHHEIVVSAAAVTVIPTLAFLGTAVALCWKRWRNR